MRLIDYLDKGASLGKDAPCLTMAGQDYSYDEVQKLSYRVGHALIDSGIAPGEKVGILSGNDPIAFSCVFGISRAAAVWCPINPRNEVRENGQILQDTDCKLLIFHSNYEKMVAELRERLTGLETLVCLDKSTDFAPSLDDWLAGKSEEPLIVETIDDLAMLPGTGGTTGKPKSVMLTGTNIETMTALTLMGYPFEPRPVYLALAPLTHAAGVLCFPIMALGGRVVIMYAPEIEVFLENIKKYRVTHTFLPPTVIYMLLDHPALDSADLSSLQCFWYGAAPISSERLAEAIERIGPMAQLFGQTEAPMMISTMAPKDHLHPDGSIFKERLTSAGRVSPLTRVAILDAEGQELPAGERGEICVRGSLVMAGYYKNPTATEEALKYDWLHTGDIGYLDEDNFLYIVDRAKDMIITGGFNVYSIEVEQVLQAHETVQDCAVVGLPDDKWGELLVAVVQPRPGKTVDEESLKAHVKAELGSVKTPKKIYVWDDLPRSKVGKVVKPEIRTTLISGAK